MANAKTVAASSAGTIVKSGAILSGADLPNFAEWDEVQIGFAPYFHPEKGSTVVGFLVGKDARDPKFVRYQMKALVDTMCRRGPANEDAEEGAVGEDVLVKKGDFFSMSVYYSLADQFDCLIWASAKTGQEFPIKVEAVNKTKTKNDRTVWNFKMHTPKEVTKTLAPLRDEWRKLVNGIETPTRPQLET